MNGQQTDFNRRVLIYDEAGFSRVCSALLEFGGCNTDIMGALHDLPSLLNGSNVGVVVTSYPYGAIILDEVRKRGIPTVVLFDRIDDRLISVLNEYSNSYCMMKPLDYDKFKGLVKQLLNGDQVSREDISIV
jgi:DNA-binding NtrC family response regulator